jgi:hypothetical protein
MKQRIYLDDVRTPIDKDWVVVRNYNEFIAKVNDIGFENIEVICLDHDLGDSAMFEYYNNVKKNYYLDYNNINEKTGYDCAKWLVTRSILTNIPIPTVYTHSANPIGSANIMGHINNYLMNCDLPQTCVRVQIEHIIEEQFILSPEERKAKWQKQS